MAEPAPQAHLALAQIPTPVPDLYTDNIRIEVTPFTVRLTLGMSGGRTVGEVRMSPIHAKVFAVLLRRFLKQAEEKFGEPISIPDVVLKDRGISLDDW